MYYITKTNLDTLFNISIKNSIIYENKMILKQRFGKSSNNKIYTAEIGQFKPPIKISEFYDLCNYNIAAFMTYALLLCSKISYFNSHNNMFQPKFCTQQVHQLKPQIKPDRQLDFHYLVSIARACGMPFQKAPYVCHQWQ